MRYHSFFNISYQRLEGGGREEGPTLIRELKRFKPGEPRVRKDHAKASDVCKVEKNRPTTRSCAAPQALREERQGLMNLPHRKKMVPQISIPLSWQLVLHRCHSNRLESISLKTSCLIGWPSEAISYHTTPRRLLCHHCGLFLASSVSDFQRASGRTTCWEESPFQQVSNNHTSMNSGRFVV